jgi:hypothetical protein
MQAQAIASYWFRPGDRITPRNWRLLPNNNEKEMEDSDGNEKITN